MKGGVGASWGVNEQVSIKNEELGVLEAVWPEFGAIMYIKSEIRK